MIQTDGQWNILQVISWITERDEDKVEWLGTGNDRLGQQRDPQEPFPLEAVISAPTAARAAIALLTDHLASGELRAAGHRLGQEPEEPLEPIPQSSWANLAFRFDPMGADHLPRPSAEPHLSWRDIMFVRDRIKVLWPPLGDLDYLIEDALTRAPGRPRRRTELKAPGGRVSLTDGMIWSAVGIELPQLGLARWLDAPDGRFRARIVEMWGLATRAATAGKLQMWGHAIREDDATETPERRERMIATGLHGLTTAIAVPEDEIYAAPVPTSADEKRALRPPLYVGVTLSAPGLRTLFPSIEAAALAKSISEVEREELPLTFSTMSLPAACCWVGLGLEVTLEEVTAYATSADSRHLARLEEAFQLIGQHCADRKITMSGRLQDRNGEKGPVGDLPHRLIADGRVEASWQRSALIPKRGQLPKDSWENVDDPVYVDVTVPTFELRQSYPAIEPTIASGARVSGMKDGVAPHGPSRIGSTSKRRGGRRQQPRDNAVKALRTLSHDAIRGNSPKILIELTKGWYAKHAIPAPHMKTMKRALDELIEELDAASALQD